MIIGYDEEYVQIEEQERVSDTLPSPGDVRIEVTVRFKEFGGRYSGVWLAQPDLVRFVKDFDEMLTSYAGKACLEAVGPGEFTLELEPNDSRGHFRVSVMLGRHQYSGANYWPVSVSGRLEVEFGQLLPALSGFRDMLN